MTRLSADIDPSLTQLPQTYLPSPTIWLFCTNITIYSSCIALYGRGAISKPVAAMLCTGCLYCFYTVTHEAAHSNVHANQRLNEWLGRISAALEGMTLPLFRLVHFQHHGYTNDPSRDPDCLVGLKPKYFMPLWVMIRLCYDNLFAIRQRLWRQRRRALQEHLVTVGIQVFVAATAIVTGHFATLALLWLAPMALSGFILELSVGWAVHYPHDSQHPLENARNLRSAGLSVLMLNQNFHLVHHLWPRIPWYRYAKAVSATEAAVLRHQTLKPDGSALQRTQHNVLTR